MKTVVTGGAGFIGSNLVRRLLDQGREVAIADDFSRGTTQNLSGFNIQPKDVGGKTSCPAVDLRDFARVVETVKGAETVFHLAARIGSITYLHGSNLNELEALSTNLVIDTNVLKACLENGVNKLVYASSVSVYPVELQNTYGTTFSEQNLRPYNPEGGYGWAKLMGEVELGYADSMDVGIARIFNIYGENSHTGEDPHVIIHLMQKTIAYPEHEFTVWGDGKQTRDFLHVSDCVDALLKLEEKASSPPVIANIGSGKTVDIGTVAQKIVGLSGKSIKIRYDTSKPVGPLSRTANISRAKSLLGWQPKVSLDEGLSRTYSWYKARSVKSLNRHSTATS